MPALATLSAELRFSFEFLWNLRKTTQKTKHNKAQKTNPTCLCCEFQGCSPEHLGTLRASKICLRVLNCAVTGSHDSPNSTKSPSGNSRYFQTNMRVPAFSKLANIKVTMEGCLKMTTGNAIDPEQPPTALHLFQTDVRIISCSNLFIGCKNVNLHYNSDQRWTLASKDLERKQTHTNKLIDWSCRRSHHSSHVIPVEQGGPHGRDRVGAHPIASPRPGGIHHIHHLPLLSPATKKSHFKSHNSSRESRYCLFVCSRDKTEHERSWCYPKLVFLILFINKITVP